MRVTIKVDGEEVATTDGATITTPSESSTSRKRKEVDRKAKEV